MMILHEISLFYHLISGMLVCDYEICIVCY